MGNINTKELAPGGSARVRTNSSPLTLAGLSSPRPRTAAGQSSGSHSDDHSSDARGSPGAPQQQQPNCGNSRLSTRAQRDAARNGRRAEREASYACPINVEETVDGGFLFPQGVYAGVQDFKGQVVRSLICARRLAPFYRPLEHVEPTWDDATLLAAVAECHDRLPAGAAAKAAFEAHAAANSGANENSDSGADSCGDDTDDNVLLTPPNSTRISDTLAKMTITHSERTEPSPTAQILWLYHSCHECPICFLLYPRLNLTHCCGQPVCTECFVQIKRRPPHRAGHGTGSGDSSEGEEGDPGNEIVSDPATCPYCAAPAFAVRFEAPPFSWGLLPPPQSEPEGTAVSVDMIRPDWTLTLASARRRAARRSAASQALVRRALLPSESADQSTDQRRQRARTVTDLASTRQHRQRRRSTLGDLIGASRMTPSQARELEVRMLEAALKQSMVEQ